MARTRIPLSAAEEETRTLREKLDLSTAEIGLTVRTTNCLEEKGIFSVRDLLNTTRSELLSINNFGEKTLEEVYDSSKNRFLPDTTRSQTSLVYEATWLPAKQQLKTKTGCAIRTSFFCSFRRSQNVATVLPVSSVGTSTPKRGFSLPRFF